MLNEAADTLQHCYYYFRRVLADLFCARPWRKRFLYPHSRIHGNSMDVDADRSALVN
jgi:hypothetical protein